MKFKTSEEIRKEKEGREKNSHKDEKLKAKLEEKAQRKYAAMAEASAKREATRQTKPQVKVLPGVIVAPALIEAHNAKAVKELIKEASKFYGGKPVNGTVTGRLSSKDVNLSNKPKFATPAPDANLVITPPTKPMPTQPHRVAPKPEPKQVWDHTTGQWAKT